MTEERKQELNARYQAAAHAMQSGVAVLQEHEPEHPKHFRVGINCAQSGIAAMAQLLMDKGIFTEEEYLEAQAVWMEKEAASYALEIQDMFGNADIKLV